MQNDVYKQVEPGFIPDMSDILPRSLNVSHGFEQVFALYKALEQVRQLVRVSALDCLQRCFLSLSHLCAQAPSRSVCVDD